MAGFGEGFLNGLSVGTMARNARVDRRTKKLANEKSERAAKREIDVDNIRAEAGAIDLDASAGKIEIRESLPEKPKLLDIEGGGEAEATTEAVNIGPKSKIVRIAERPSGLKSVLDSYKRALASGDEQATSDVARMVQISAVGALKEYDKTSDPAKLQSVAEDMGLELKTDDKGQLINPWSGEPVVKEDKERFRLQVLQSLVDPVAAMKEWGSAGDRATERDQKERTVANTEAKTKTDEKQVDDAYVLGKARNELEAKRIDALKGYYDSMAASTANKAVTVSGWSKEGFDTVNKNALAEVQSMLGIGDGAVAEGNPMADPAYYDNLGTTPVEFQFQAQSFASDILADHGPQGRGQALAAEGALFGARMLAGDPDAKGELKDDANNVPWIQTVDGSQLPASRDMFHQIGLAQRNRAAAKTKGNADRVAAAAQKTKEAKDKSTAKTFTPGALPLQGFQ